jgi:hypothetical protein
MLATTLHDLHASGRLTVQEIADAWMIEAKSVYPYLHDRWPTLDKAIDLLRWCCARGRSDVALDILHALLRGTPIIAIDSDPELDINGDGTVDLQDLLASTARLAASSGDLVSGILRAGGDQYVERHEWQELHEHVEDLLIVLAALRGHLDYQIARRPPRRRARPRGTPVPGVSPRGTSIPGVSPSAPGNGNGNNGSPS